MKNDGGPAFPFPGKDTEYPHAVGMTLRDYFAAKVVAATTAGCQDRNVDGTANINYHVVARDAYKQADAMLAAREAK